MLKSFEESKPLSWPPSPEKFDSVSVDKHTPKNVKILIFDSECHKMMVSKNWLYQRADGLQYFY